MKLYNTVDKNFGEILDISLIELVEYNTKTLNLWEQMSSHASANRYPKPFLESTFLRGMEGRRLEVFRQVTFNEAEFVKELCET